MKHRFICPHKTSVYICHLSTTIRRLVTYFKISFGDSVRRNATERFCSYCSAERTVHVCHPSELDGPIFLNIARLEGIHKIKNCLIINIFLRCHWRRHCTEMFLNVMHMHLI